MADLLGSLLPPLQSSQTPSVHHVSSNESFHSLTSTGGAKEGSSPPADQMSVPVLDQMQPPKICDLSEYLDDPANVALSSSNGPAGYSDSSSNPRKSGAEPVPLGTSSSQHVAALHILCQSKGLPNPIFRIEQLGEGHLAAFRGTIQVGDLVIKSDQAWGNKKSARENLSKEALPAVRELTVERNGKRALSGDDAKNWVELLHCYYQGRPTGSGRAFPTYEYYALGVQYSATCTIPTHPDHTFGAKTEAYVSKKGAQAAAAKEAVQLLIQEGRLDVEGHSLANNKKKSGSSSRCDLVSKQGTHAPLCPKNENCVNVLDVPESPPSLTQFVAELSILLGLQAPQYHLFPASPQAPTILNGFATFLNGSTSDLPGVKGNVGEVRNVFGKNNAKQEIARQLRALLETAARSRGFKVREV